MRPIDFKERNIIFNKPEGMTDEECSPLPAYVGQDQNGHPHINTVWMPSKEDLEALLAGRPLILCICGTGMPPVSLFTTDENGIPNA